MKKLFALALCCLILAGCAFQQTPREDESGTVIPSGAVDTLPPQIPLSIYVPGENAENFEILDYTISELEPYFIVAILVDEGVLSPEVMLWQAEFAGTQLNLDFNQAFADQLNTYGTSGERMMMGCVVNTFLRAYDMETVYITVEGEILESGHVIYDFPMGFFE